MDIRKLNEKFLNPKGPSLTDVELKNLFNYYQRLISQVGQLDSCFQLFETELHRRCNVLMGFREARRR